MIRAHTQRGLCSVSVYFVLTFVLLPQHRRAGLMYEHRSLFFFTKKINLMVFEREEWVSLRLLGSERAISF